LEGTGDASLVVAYGSDPHFQDRIIDVIIIVLAASLEVFDAHEVAAPNRERFFAPGANAISFADHAEGTKIVAAAHVSGDDAVNIEHRSLDRSRFAILFAGKRRRFKKSF
jgi:hypothetical protein